MLLNKSSKQDRSPGSERVKLAVSIFSAGKGGREGDAVAFTSDFCGHEW